MNPPLVFTRSQNFFAEDNRKTEENRASRRILIVDCVSSLSRPAAPHPASIKAPSDIEPLRALTAGQTSKLLHPAQCSNIPGNPCWRQPPVGLGSSCKLPTTSRSPNLCIQWENLRRMLWRGRVLGHLMFCYHVPQNANSRTRDIVLKFVDLLVTSLFVVVRDVNSCVSSC